MWGQTNSNSVLDKANGKVCKLPKPTDEEREMWHRTKPMVQLCYRKWQHSHWAHVKLTPG